MDTKLSDFYASAVKSCQAAILESTDSEERNFWVSARDTAINNLQQAKKYEGNL